MWKARKGAVGSIALASSLLGTGYYLADSGRRRKVELTAVSAYRIGNLLSTVGVICADYGYHLNIKPEDKVSLLEQRQDELLAIQSRMEELSTELLNSSPEVLAVRTPEQETVLRQQIAETRAVMNTITQEISELLEKGSKHHDLHVRNAKRLTNMCAANGGLYIKLGQHIAMLDYVVPAEYRKELSVLLGTTPPSSWESVRRVLKEDLGDDPENLFDRFDPVPIASASLAQVHVAYKDGRKYAVKVQHEGLSESATVDTLVITNIVAAIHSMFPQFNYIWLTKEMNRNLPLELNFQCERGNIERTTHLLAAYIQRGEVAVPTVQTALSSRRVLTMTFEEGCYVTNSEKIQEWGLDRAQLGNTIAKVFCEQIYRHGFVHCDPHEANILVRRNPARPQQSQVVLLDHGLYRQLEDSFRRDYCRLWQGIALGNAVQIERYCKRMEAGDLYTLLAAMITARPWDDIVSDDLNRVSGGMNRPADSVMLQAYAQKYLTRIVELLGMVPSDLLLLFKTNDCLRHLDALLASGVNSSAVAAQVVAEVILGEDLQAVQEAGTSQSWLQGWAQYIGAYADYWGVQGRLVGLYGYLYWQGWQKWYTGSGRR